MSSLLATPAPRAANVHSMAAHRAGRTVPHAVLRAIELMSERYSEPLTMNELAASVFVSTFHFSRIFAKATGVTPGRYLTAVRMVEAKRLLLTTTMTVSDIVCTVGYSSVGTFTTRFTQAVGMSPARYRDPQVHDMLLAIAPRFQHLPSPDVLEEPCSAHVARRQASDATVRARVELPAGGTTHLVIGVFDESVPQCAPVAWTSVRRTGTDTVTIPAVPAGRWHVLAAAESVGDRGERTLSVAARRPITVGGDAESHVRLRMRPLLPIDPPFAISLAGGDDPIAVAAAQRVAAAS
jgi:AraC family transcriptional regulator